MMHISIRKWNYLILLLTLSLGFYSTTFSNSKYGTETQEVILTGTLTVETFLDANDKSEKAFILYLDKSIDVIEDKFGGPASNVKKLQLILIKSEDINKAKKFLNRKIKVIGTLSYGFSAHHHTEVLMTVKHIETM
jgi:adenine-specific DNA methylase